jgi:hypothetical protein
MPWSFPGVSYPHELTYTQTLGFQPDVALLKCLPQATNIPASGNVTMSWAATTVVLPNCIVDLASITLTQDGRYLRLPVMDRRERWKKVAPISGEYNTIRVGEVVGARQQTFRELGTILMTALGEPSADVSVLPTNVYPPVSWECEPVIEAAQALFEESGYSVVLGYGSEVVKVVQLGTGATLSTTNRFVGSDTIDPKVVPRYIRNCFKPSQAQVRLMLEPVGLDTDGTWQLIDDLSFTPGGGWERIPPYSLPGLVGLTDEQLLEAVGYVRRAYRVKGFADGTWDLPVGTGALSGLTDILPLQNRLLDTEDLRDDESRRPFRLYGKYFKTEDETGQPPIPGGTETANGDRVTGRSVRFDGENGLVIFEEPIWRVFGSDYLPADLWLECTIQVRDQTNFSWNHYEYDVEVVPGGLGYHTVKHEQRAETIVQYDADHVVTGSTTNQAALDALGGAWATSLAALYATTAGQYVVYNQPDLTLRCDGAIIQIQHVLTCGAGEHAVNRTIASSHFEFDRGVPSRAQRVAHLRALSAGVGVHKQALMTGRRENADD